MKLVKSIILQSCGALLRDHSSKILFYHDVYNRRQYTPMGTSWSLFQQHLDAITESGFKIVSQISAPKDEVQICFDDGFLGLYDCMKHWECFDWRPTIFLAVELIGKDGYLVKEKIKEMASYGFVFQSHGWSHEVLTSFEGKELWREVAESKQFLEELLEKGISEICFPVGLFSNSVMEACRKADYQRMYSSIPGNFDSPVFPGVLRRNLVQYYNVNEFKGVLLGGLRPFASRYYRMHYQQ